MKSTNPIVDAAKALLRFLAKKEFNTFFIGGKCRTDLYNLYNEDNKLKIRNINLVTDATVDELKKIFPALEIDNENHVLPIAKITFANTTFTISFFENSDTVNTLLHLWRLSLKSML